MKTIATFDASGDGTGQKFLSVLTADPKSTGIAPNNSEQNNEEACIANISPRERLKRLMGGVIPFVFALAILAWQISADVYRLWRLPLFILFVAAASGYFQWRDKT
jgi:hypothetical protein